MSPRIPGLIHAAGLAALLLAARPLPALDGRLLPGRSPVLVDASGRVVGLAIPGISGPESVQVLIRAGDRDLVLEATAGGLALSTAFGQVAFDEPDCAGGAWFVSLTTFQFAVAPLALGPGNRVLYTPDGPPQTVTIKSYWDPMAGVPCQADNSTLPVAPALLILDLDSFSPPFTLR